MNNNENQIRKGKKKLILIPILALTTLLLSLSMVFAYYSSFFQDYINLDTATLEIDVEYVVKVNGVETQLATINGFNPGDVIVIAGTVTNEGSQSAWVRELLTIQTDAGVLPYFYAFNTELTLEQIINNDNSASAIAINEGQAILNGVRVINGTGVNGQIETGVDFNYIGADAYDFELTLYFTLEAPNSTQGKAIRLDFLAQALQFANNNDTEPTTAAWTSIMP